MLFFIRLTREQEVRLARMIRAFPGEPKEELMLSVFTFRQRCWYLVMELIVGVFLLASAYLFLVMVFGMK